MSRALRACVITLFVGLANGQTFEVADVHVSPTTSNQFVRTPPARGGRYEIRSATMVDLVRTAYGVDGDKVVGGPSWLELDRFDVIAKVPPDSTADTHKLMLQALLADRFRLEVHKDTKPLPTYVLTTGKKPQLKEAEGSEQTGCKPKTSTGAPQEGGVRLMTSSPTGAQTTISLGPGMTIQYECRSISMEAFAGGLRGMLGASLGPNQVLDQTGLKGSWNFDVKWSMQFMGPVGGAPAERVSIFEAMEKQLGLKLEEKQVPTPVLVVDSVTRTPTPNPPEVAKELPRIPLPTEFEVTDVKPAGPEFRMGRFAIQPGGRFVAQGFPLRFLIARAFNTNTTEQIAGLPKWADVDRFDITAQAPSIGPSAPPLDMESVAPMLRSLLVDRFKMKYHTEDRPVSTYALVAGKPKMKKADPASRTWCRNTNAPVGAPPGSRLVTCQNVTMAQFAERLLSFAPWLNWPVLNATALDGNWDFSLTFGQNFPMMVGGPGRGGDAPPASADMPAAAEPTGAVTIFDAVEKQLGLKLEPRKRPMPVIVIDQIEQKPTEN